MSVNLDWQASRYLRAALRVSQTEAQLIRQKDKVWHFEQLGLYEKADAERSRLAEIDEQLKGEVAERSRIFAEITDGRDPTERRVGKPPQHLLRQHKSAISLANSELQPD